jgi:hypothetical protein
MTRGFKAILGVAIAALTLAVTVRARDDDRPSTAQIAFAQQVSALMVNELVAALFQEFNETTADNVEHGKQAISLIFNDVNRDMRLIGAFGRCSAAATTVPTTGSNGPRSAKR